MAETLQIRLSAEEQKRFKILADELGMKHGEILSVMMNALESEKAAAVVPDMAQSVQNFNSYLAQIQRLYNQAAQAVGEQKDLAKEAVRHQIESKDETIRDLQTRLAEAEERAAKADALTSEVERLKKSYDEAQKTIEALSAIRDTIPDLAQVQEQQQRIAQLEAASAEKDRTIEILTEALKPWTKEKSD